ncbi:MAG: DUF4363 family protein [Clostridia bacterium]|nr:DUF4363 family protein [Clostridia bacterium]
MKFFVCALVIIIIIGILCAWGTIAGTRKIDSLLNIMSEATPHGEAVPKNAVEVVEKLSKKWEEDVFFISMLLPHHHLDEVKEKLVTLTAYASTDEFAEWHDATLVLEEEFRHIRGLLGMSADNVL